MKLCSVFIYQNLSKSSRVLVL